MAAAESGGGDDGDSMSSMAKGRVMNPDNLVLDELERKKILGEGTFGRVYLVRAARSKYAEHYGKWEAMTVVAAYAV